MPVPSSREIQEFSIQKNVGEGPFWDHLTTNKMKGGFFFLPGFYHSALIVGNDPETWTENVGFHNL